MTQRKSYREYKEAPIPWLATIPSDWTVQPLFSAASERKVKNLGMRERNLLSLSYGQIVPRDINSNEGLLPESFETYQIVDRDDIVFRMTDLQNDQRSLRSALVRERGIITSAYIAVRPEGINPSFLGYLMRAYDTQKVFYAMGGGLRQSLKFEELRRLPLVIPSQPEQIEIVRFLDRETARIDTLIAKKTRFIELLKEKRQAVITKAVTKGLDDSVEMKDSRIPWMGAIPAHWRAVPSNWLFLEIKDRSQPDDQHLSASQKHGVIPLSEFERLEGRRVTHAEKNLDQRKHVEVGDFVISMRSFQGGIEIVKARGCVRSSYVALRAGASVDSRFFSYLFKSSAYIQGLQSTATFIRDGQDLSYANFRQVKLPLLCMDEQVRIASYLNRVVSRIDVLVSKTERSIELLKEHRSALITAAVTGKIDVREAA